MLSFKLLVILTGFLVCLQVVGGATGRTCTREIKYTVKVSQNIFWEKDVKKTRVGLFCCDGYNPIHGRHSIEVKSDNECIPFCYPTCPAKSTCQPPTSCECSTGAKLYAKHYANRCKCNKGFVRTYEGQCTPICPDHCTNGICNELICTCNEGYKVNSHQRCIPQCNETCTEDQECTSPGKCSSKACKEPGYERNEMNECVPKCQDGCLNGNCTAPETCICNEGYQKNEVTTVCEAKCDNCTNGFCVMPQECECNLGFINVEGVCVEITIAEESSEDMQTFSFATLFLWISVSLFVLVVAATLGYYLKKRIAADSDKNEINAEVEPQGVSDSSPQHCDSDLSGNLLAHYEVVGEAPTIVIGQGAMPMSGPISNIRPTHLTSATQVSEPVYLELL